MKRTRMQAISALTFFTTAAATTVWPQWIEVLGVDPDHGNGSAEWAIVAVLALVAVFSGALAVQGLRRMTVETRLEA